jgi:hypothetical protein
MQPHAARIRPFEGGLEGVEALLARAAEGGVVR